ncbi:PREDICTED: uncharacterized protein LOC107355240 [Acropora digitifera]|uniref:uncharacterized protein LOC107355240 n=1 Tax=Acropora digitifera TaxID=70779 RepID=UPI00077A5ED8|nr:PREDICTED: uncharacterized protein LOC107355240 [Acropora digitifera]
MKICNQHQISLPQTDSSGFVEEVVEDNVIVEDRGQQRTMTCGTEKSKHRAKNHRTAGIFAIDKPCSIVVEVKELFGSESKTQVYAHLHELLQKPSMHSIESICYDDACHLKKFAQNPVRSSLSVISDRLAKMEMVCDKFHFKNHTDSWCKRNCNPYNSSILQVIQSCYSVPGYSVHAYGQQLIHKLDRNAAYTHIVRFKN